MKINIANISSDMLQQELLCRAESRTVMAIDRAEATLDVLQKKLVRQTVENRRLSRRIAAAKMNRITHDPIDNDRTHVRCYEAKETINP